MRKNLRMSADADMATTKVVLQARVDTLNCGPGISARGGVCFSVLRC